MPSEKSESAGPSGTYLGRLADLWTRRAILAAFSILGLSLTLRFAYERPFLAKLFVAPLGAVIAATLYLARENAYKHGLSEDTDAE